MIDAVARNVRRLRILQGRKQEELADKAGISRNAYRAIETGAAEPRVSNLQKIADALEVSLMDLVREVPELKTLRFRSHKTMSAQQRAERDDVVTRIALWLKDFNELEQMLGVRRPSPIGGAVMTKRKPRQVAGEIRSKLTISPDCPVSDICDVLEDVGIKLFLAPIKSRVFFGLSVGANDEGPAIAINTRMDIPVERRIFSTAHEFGHLLMHQASYDGSVREEIHNDPEEKEADAFAGHFLMPQKAFEKKWDEYSGLHFVDRVIKVKRHFQVSYKTVLFRLIETGGANKSIWQIFQQHYQIRFGKPLSQKTEPFPLAEPDFEEDRLDLLVRQALEKELISISRAAEILGISLENMRNRINSWSLTH